MTETRTQVQADATSDRAWQQDQARDIAQLARLVLMIAGGTIGVISLIAIAGSAFNGAARFTRTTELVFNALLPLLGTWVGTVLAYYFSKQNFEAASNSVQRMAELTADQKLGQYVVIEKMLQPSQITSYTIPESKTEADVPLSVLHAKLVDKFTRLPILDPKGVVRYIVHQSGLFKFLADQALAGKDLKTLTLKDLVDDAVLKSWVSNIVYMPASASVAAAKQKMEQQPGCQDLIVTQTGKNTEPMLGWMTNVDIGRLSKA